MAAFSLRPQNVPIFSVLVGNILCHAKFFSTRVEKKQKIYWDKTSLLSWSLFSSTWKYLYKMYLAVDETMCVLKFVIAHKYPAHETSVLKLHRFSLFCILFFTTSSFFSFMARDIKTTEIFLPRNFQICSSYPLLELIVKRYHKPYPNQGHRYKSSKLTSISSYSLCFLQPLNQLLEVLCMK